MPKSLAPGMLDDGAKGSRPGLLKAESSNLAGLASLAIRTPSERLGNFLAGLKVPGCVLNCGKNQGNRNGTNHHVVLGRLAVNPLE